MSCAFLRLQPSLHFFCSHFAMPPALPLQPLNKPAPIFDCLHVNLRVLVCGKTSVVYWLSTFCNGLRNYHSICLLLHIQYPTNSFLVVYNSVGCHFIFKLNSVPYTPLCIATPLLIVLVASGEYEQWLRHSYSPGGI